MRSGHALRVLLCLSCGIRPFGRFGGKNRNRKHPRRHDDSCRPPFYTQSNHEVAVDIGDYKLTIPIGPPFSPTRFIRRQKGRGCVP